MAIETKQLHALSKIYREQVAEDMQKGYVVTAADKKGNTKAWQGYKSGAKKKDGTPLYTAADHLKNEEVVYEKVATGPRLGEPREKGATHMNAGEQGKISKRTKAWMDKKGQPGSPGGDAMKAREAEHKARRGVKKAKKDYDGDGKIESGKAEYFGSKDKAIKKAMKKEGFSNWRHDLKEIPDYEQIPVTAKKRNEKISEKNVKNNIKINPEMAESVGSAIDKTLGAAGEVADTAIKLPAKAIGYAKGLKKGLKKAAKGAETKAAGDASPKNESYEKQKTKEVMGALKKRDLKQDVKKKIAADIVKKKGDTSKSDDRYAYESKLWDEVAANLTELGELNDADFKVEGYQRDPEKGEEKERKAKRERKGGYDEKRERRMSSPTRGIDSPAFKEFMRSRGM
jgi:hypothetical protein